MSNIYRHARRDADARATAMQKGILSRQCNPFVTPSHGTRTKTSKNRVCTMPLDMVQWRGVSHWCKLIYSDLKLVRVWLLKPPAKVGEETVKICPIGVCESELSVLI